MYDRDYCRKIESVKDKLNAVLGEVGLSIEGSRITYGLKLTVKYELIDKSNQGAAEMLGSQVKFFCQRNGLPENIIGTKFYHKRSQYEVIGVDPDKPKRSIRLKRDDGKPFICPPSFVIGALANQ